MEVRTSTALVHTWETEQTLLHLYECLRVCTIVFGCKCMCVSVPIACAREQMLRVCVFCWITMHVCVMCLGDGRLWLSFGLSTPCLSFGGAGGDVAVHSPWQTSIIKSLLRMLIYRTEVCVCMNVTTRFLFWSCFVKIPEGARLDLLTLITLKLNFTPCCRTVNLPAPRNPLLFLITSAVRLTPGSQQP